MTTNRTLLAGCVLLAGVVTTIAFVELRRPAPTTTAIRVEARETPRPHGDQTPAVPDSSRLPDGMPPPPPLPAPPPADPVWPAPRATKGPSSSLPPAQPKMTKAEANAHPAVPDARLALSFVGIDREAEAVWLSTINDPTVPPEARKDLIEDLNEDGFPDPKHLTPDDLPLILSRLDLIEHFAPTAIDDTNLDAFAEAYKDLVQMLDRVANP